MVTHLVVVGSEIKVCGIEDLHCLVAHVLAIGRALVDRRIRRSVADNFGVGNGDFLGQRKVDISLGKILVCRALRDAVGIDEEVGGKVAVLICGVVEPELVVVFDHREVVARVVGGNGGFPALHLVEDLVHNVALEERFLRFQRIQRRLPCCAVFGIDINPGTIHCRTECIAGIVELQDLACILLVPHQIPRAVVRLVHDRGVIDDADHAVGERHAVFVVCIIVQSAETLADARIVRNVVKVELFKHAFFDHARDHVVGGQDHIVARRAALELGIQIFVRGIGGVDDLDRLAVGLGIPLLKFGIDIKRALAAVRNIFAPVVDVQHAVGGESRQRKHGAERKENGKRRKKFFHLVTSVCAGTFAWLFFSLLLPARLERTSRASTAIKISVDSAYISGVTRFLVME